MTEQSTFAGTQSEWAALMQALAHNCQCKSDQQGQLVEVCAPHRAFAEDDRYVRGLIWFRRIGARLRREEQTRGQEPHFLHGRPEEHAG